MQRNNNNQKKFRFVLISLLALFLIGTGSFMRILVEHERKKNVQETLNKGNYLTSLIALHPLNSFNGNRRDFFVKTLMEHVSSEGLAYFMIHDQKGDILLSLAPQDLETEIPGNIRMKSIYAMGLTKQAFKIKEKKQTIYEFAKPIFENGEKAGTVRLGLNIPRIALFSMERISLVAMIAFFALATGAILYYSMAFALRPLSDLFQNRGGRSNGSPVPGGPDKYAGIMHIIQDLEHSFLQIKEELNLTEEDNIKMATKLGVAIFEKNQISKIIDTLDMGIILTDIHENVLNINAYMLKLLKKKKEEATKHPLTEVLQNEDMEKLLSQQDLDTPSQNLRQVETTFPGLAPGKTFLITLTYLKEDEGGVLSDMISIKDITQQKSIEKASQGFIAQVAHEFLTPLTTIGSYNEMLMDGEIEDREMQKEFYNTISEETTRLTRLIQNLLNIAKMEMGGLTLNKGLVKTDWLVEDTISSIEGSAIKKNIGITKNLPDIFPTLVGDKELLKIAIINVLGNAVKYSGENSAITISLTEQDNMVIFTLADTGYGISEEDLPHIFDKFYRSKDSQIADQIGSGLGLPMTAEIIHLHGGEIEVSSEVGRGTEFTIYIPKEEYYLGTQ